ncbi:hypothetical protein ACFC4G_44365 [Streptomyces sp. NPDC056002]|uniref:hypothetical protein n=1 Tax=Streptomyces sp. NPDC056002 TaxID=3345675 RepID=UPI0035D8E251
MTTTEDRTSTLPTMRLICALAAVAMVVAAVLVWQGAQLESGALVDFVALGIVMTGLAVGGAAWAAWSVQRRLRTLATRALGSLVSVGVVVAIASLTLSAWAYMDPHGAYAPNYGGADACLSQTPYSTARAQLSTATKANVQQLQVVPQSEGAESTLVFIDRKGKLTPTDTHTLEFISQHSC